MKASRNLFRFLKPYWYYAVLGPLAMVVEVALDLMQPRLVQLIIDQGIAKGDMSYILRTLVLMLAMTAGGLVMGGICAVMATLAAQNFGADLRSATFSKVQSLSFKNLDSLESSTIITRLSNDVRQVQELVMVMLRFMVRAPLLMLGSLVMGIWTSPQLSLLFLILIPIIVFTLFVIVGKTFPMFGMVQKRLDNLNTVTQENLSGARVVKAYTRKNHERQRFQEANEELVSQNVAAVRLGSLTNPLMTLTLNCGIIAALYIGGVKVQGGGLAVGEVVAFINYLFQSLMALMRLSVMVIQIARSEASAQRVKEILDEVPSLPSAENAEGGVYSDWQVSKGEIVFENVSFAYDESDNESDIEPVLKNVSFVVSGGKTTAILGSTGAGKSTIASLAARFYDVSSGRITIDGVDIRRIPEMNLRETIGIALQESVLFSGSIRENIAYAKPSASEEEIENAAYIANAQEFISALPDGYEARIGQRGVNLSGGQKQRLAIARAILPQPRILILDDSTSAVDVRTESQIHAAIAAQGFSQTRLIVAQRISTVHGADEIIVLENGEIESQGTHYELLEKSAIYREIYQSQKQNEVIEHEIV